MLAKKIKFEDFDGNTREKTYYFHMKKSEILEWLTTNGEYTLDKVLGRLTEERNGKEIMETFKDLIHRSYGVKSLDGMQFVKSENEWEKFYNSEAYSTLFCELVLDGDAAARFLNGVIPKEISREIERTIKTNPEGIPDNVRSAANAFIEASDKPATEVTNIE